MRIFLLLHPVYQLAEKSIFGWRHNVRLIWLVFARLLLTESGGI